MIETSVEAFTRVTPELSQRRKEALAAVRAQPYSTARELEDATGWRKINARLIELERLGLIVRGAARQCAVTGFAAHTWRVRVDTDQPTAPPKNTSWKDLYFAEKIRAQNAEAELRRIQESIRDAGTA